MQKVSEHTDARAIALDRLAWVRRFHEGILAGVPDDALFVRAGGAGNHAMWVMGHIASTDAFILNAMGGRAPALPRGFDELFAGGSKVFDDPGAYPDRAEMVDALDATRRALVRWAESLEGEALYAATPEDLRPFAPDVITTLHSLGAHEMFHAGQVASVRAALGMAPVMF
ncbi:MAG: DinB family protein [Phycisphaerales bacterium]